MCYVQLIGRQTQTSGVSLSQFAVIQIKERNNWKLNITV